MVVATEDGSPMLVICDVRTALQHEAVEHMSRMLARSTPMTWHDALIVVTTAKQNLAPSLIHASLACSFCKDHFD